jgi:hypothetical protein
MDPRTAATRVPDPDAVEFVRFCYRRRRVGWPELYDEMCAVAGRGLFRGYGTDDLAAFGIGFGLFDLPALASLARGIVAEEQALRRPMTVTITTTSEESPDVSAHAATDVIVDAPAPAPVATRPEPANASPAIRFVPAASPV